MARTVLRRTELEQIEIVGAREHNLRIAHLELPKRKLVVFTGVSGSGKSSLAFDTLFAEGQRRYVESLSSYARQFLGRLDRPDVERVRGLSPTIAIEQKAASSNPRSTVGTITEIYDYLRVLYARAGTQHCHECGKVVKGRSAEEIGREIASVGEGASITVLAPLVTHRKGEFREIFERLGAAGYVRVRVDGTVHRLDEVPAIDKRKKHDVQVVVDRVVVGADAIGRLTESVELALREGEGEILVDVAGELRSYSEQRTCCGHSFPELSPQSFSFNSPLGMCPHCNGLGRIDAIDPALVVADRSLSIREGAIAPWATSMQRGHGWRYRIVEAMSEACAVDLDTPWRKLSKKKRDLVLYGVEERIAVEWENQRTGSHGNFAVKFEGVLNLLERRMKDAASDRMRAQYQKYFSEQACRACKGRRLRPETLAVLLSGRSIAEVSAMTVARASETFGALGLEGNTAEIAAGVLREVRSRLRFLLDVGLDYLTLDRSGPTLSGGEAQRIRLASQLGSELSGVMYVLDEPSIGLHQRDNRRLIATLEGLRDAGNTVIVVEHDEETIRSADHVVDFGPGAGHEGGSVMFSGTPEALARCETSLTGQYLRGTRRIDVPEERRPPNGAWITIRGARANNLHGIDVELPVACLTAVTGVSGAGKSSLVNQILLPALERELHGSSVSVGSHDAIEGLSALDKVIAIDQKPIGRTPRSNPGTYTKAFDEMRTIFAQLPEARARGFTPGRFSFNVKGGRCEACSGGGVVKVEMHFLSDVYVRCDVCHGQRYNAQTLAVRYRGKSISDVLATSIDECHEMFSSYPKLARILGTLVEVGLGYLRIGQPAPTISGGEAQRVKLSRELGKRQTGRTLYVLDEPTTGLHFEDIRKLLGVLQTLVDAGNTVVVIEHNLDVIKHADWVVDLGPEGGAAGGRVVAKGTPEEVARSKTSYTGQFLRGVLPKTNGRRRARRMQS